MAYPNRQNPQARSSAPTKKSYLTDNDLLRIATQNQQLQANKSMTFIAPKPGSAQHALHQDRGRPGPSPQVQPPQVPHNTFSTAHPQAQLPFLAPRVRTDTPDIRLSPPGQAYINRDRPTLPNMTFAPQPKFALPTTARPFAGQPMETTMDVGFDAPRAGGYPAMNTGGLSGAPFCNECLGVFPRPGEPKEYGTFYCSCSDDAFDSAMAGNDQFGMAQPHIDFEMGEPHPQVGFEDDIAVNVDLTYVPRFSNNNVQSAAQTKGPAQEEEDEEEDDEDWEVQVTKGPSLPSEPSKVQGRFMSGIKRFPRSLKTAQQATAFLYKIRHQVNVKEDDVALLKSNPVKYAKIIFYAMITLPDDVFDASGNTFRTLEKTVARVVIAAMAMHLVFRIIYLHEKGSRLRGKDQLHGVTIEQCKATERIHRVANLLLVHKTVLKQVLLGTKTEVVVAEPLACAKAANSYAKNNLTKYNKAKGDGAASKKRDGRKNDDAEELVDDEMSGDEVIADESESEVVDGHAGTGGGETEGYTPASDANVNTRSSAVKSGKATKSKSGFSQPSGPKTNGKRKRGAANPAVDSDSSDSELSDDPMLSANTTAKRTPTGLDSFMAPPAHSTRGASKKLSPTSAGNQAASRDSAKDPRYHNPIDVDGRGYGPSSKSKDVVNLDDGGDDAASPVPIKRRRRDQSEKGGADEEVRWTRSRR